MDASHKALYCEGPTSLDDANAEPKHHLPSPASNTPGIEFPQSASPQDNNRKRTQVQEPDEPFDYLPAKCHHTTGLYYTQSSTKLNKETRREKRRHSSSNKSHDSNTSKRPRLSHAIHEPTIPQENPIRYWAAHGVWPKEYIQKEATMSEATSKSSKKRRTESTHRSDRIERLADNGVFMKSSSLIQKSSKDLCHELMGGDRQPSQYSPFPLERLSAVLERINGLNESRVQRDVTPWVVPSAERLFFCGDLDDNIIGDEVNAEWTRCATMGSTRPKPDYTAGLLPQAFGRDEMVKLRNYASPSRPVFFTPDICFPFLICEVKAGEQGLNQADRQNIHSASIAVKAVIELFKAAFGSSSERVQNLYGQVLVFTVSHDNERVALNSHYAVATGKDDELQFYRYQIALISLSAKDGEDRFIAYNFVRNIYDQFAPAHRRRIQDATALLPGIQEYTNLSFSASEMALEEAQSQSNSQDTQSREDAGFKTPGLPASALKQLEQMGRLMEQHREDARVQREQMERQMEQQREDARVQREQMERQMEQQREQLEQQKDLISLLKKEARA